VPPLEAGTVERISGLLPPLTWIANPVDTGRPSDTFGPVLDAVLDDPAVDVVALYALDEPDALDPATVLRGRVGRVPLVVGTGGPPETVVAVRSVLGRLGVPAFPAPDRVVTAVGAIVADSIGQARRQARTAGRGRPTGAEIGGDLDEDQAKALFESVGIATMPRRACSTRDEAHRALAELGGPVVVKVLDAGILHKTEVGGVRVGVATDQAMEEALDAIDRIPTRGATRYLVEAQAEPGVELIVGGVRDPIWGPVVLVGTGGVGVELAEAGVLAMAPLAGPDALELVASLPTALLEGFRGAEPVDRAALAAAVTAVGDLLAEHPAIQEIDCNPLRLTRRGPVALDALVAVARPAAVSGSSPGRGAGPRSPSGSAVAPRVCCRSARSRPTNGRG
jgi:acetyltransferase